MTRDDLRYILALGSAIILVPLAGAVLLFGFFRVVGWLLASP